MPIIHLGQSSDRGKPSFAIHLLQQDHRAYDPALPYEQRPVIYGPHVYFTYESHQGLCLRDFERNGYHDSDFYMVVWNPEKHEPETILFASTRGWSYPCYGSSPDATADVRREYENYLFAKEWLFDRQQIAKRVKTICDFRQFARDYGKHLGFPHWRLTALRKVMSAGDLSRLVNLLGNARLRSAFKLKMRQHVIDWLNDPAPKYRTPLSSRQMEWL